MNKKLSLFSLIMLIVASVDNIRNLPASALFGGSLIFFFIVSALVFLIPTALVSAELASAYPEKGGVYRWVSEAFGSRLAMMAIWMQWINTMVWYPTILSAIAGTAAYLINPELIHDKVYLVTTILIIFWSITFLNFLGMHFSSLVNTVCGLMGIVAPMFFLIILGGIWIFSGQPLQISLTKESLLPSLSDTTGWVSLIAIMASFLGMELAGVHVNDIRNPQKNFPKAILIASFFILITMIFGSLAIAFILPLEEISLVAGVMQVLSSLFEKFDLEFLTPILTILITLGLTGGLINWLISPAKGLLHAAEFGYLPKFFRKKNIRGVPTNILLMQGVVVTIFSLLFLLIPSVNAFYWFLTALSTELYMIMYILMFFAAIRLHYTHKERNNAFRVPGKCIGIWSIASVGALGCLATIIVSFIPPEHVAVGSPSKYVAMVAIATFATILPLFFFYAYKKKEERLS